MFLISSLWCLWRNFIHRERIERDLDDELRATRDLLVDEKIRAGLSIEAAARAAAVELGGAAQIREQVWDIKRGAALDQFRRDVQYAARGLWRRRLFATTTILSLAIAIGSAVPY